MSTEVSASIILTGQGFDPAEISAKVNLIPTRTFRMGDRMRGSLLYKFDFWKLTSPLPKTSDLEEHVQFLLEQLEPNGDTWLKLSREFDLGLACVVRCYGTDTPAIYFCTDTVNRLASLNASIDIDLYIFEDE